MSMPTPTPVVELYGVKIERNVPESKLNNLRVDTWPKWSCGPSKFEWTFTAAETVYLVEGKAKVKVEENKETFEIGAGDLVVFPSGMKVTLDVIEAIDKHYKR